MPNPVWPAGLPQYVNQDSFTEEKISNVIRTPMEGGDVKIRRRFTAAPIKYAFSFTITDAQKAIFDTFHHTTCKHGSLAWDWIRPIELTSATFIFMSEPKVTAVGPFTFLLNFEAQTTPL
jgi:hypothetical protein